MNAKNAVKRQNSWNAAPVTKVAYVKTVSKKAVILYGGITKSASIVIENEHIAVGIVMDIKPRYTVKQKVSSSQPFYTIHQGNNRKVAISMARYEAYHGLIAHGGGRLIVIDEHNPNEYIFMYEESAGGWGYQVRNGVQCNVRLWQGY